MRKLLTLIAKPTGPKDWGSVFQTIKPLLDVGFEAQPAGSRVYGGATEASDWDVVLKTPYTCGDTIERVTAAGFTYSSEHYEGVEDEWMCFRDASHKINLIITTERELFERYVLCGVVAAKLRLSKSGRATMFNVLCNWQVDDRGVVYDPSL